MLRSPNLVCMLSICANAMWQSFLANRSKLFVWRILKVASPSWHSLIGGYSALAMHTTSRRVTFGSPNLICILSIYVTQAWPSFMTRRSEMIARHIVQGGVPRLLSAISRALEMYITSTRAMLWPPNLICILSIYVNMLWQSFMARRSRLFAWHMFQGTSPAPPPACPQRETLDYAAAHRNIRFGS